MLKRFKVTIEGDCIIMDKNIKPKVRLVVPMFHLDDALTIEEDEHKKYYLSIDHIELERID